MNPLEEHQPAKKSKQTQTRNNPSSFDFASNCQRLDELTYENYEDWTLTVEDVRTIRQLLIGSSAVTEFRSKSGQKIKIFRKIKTTNDQTAVLNGLK